MKTIPALAAAATLIAACFASAQTLDPAVPEFEVAVVRENRSGKPRGRIELVNARLNAINMTLRELIARLPAGVSACRSPQPWRSTKTM